jgi:hypothetical protein
MDIFVNPAAPIARSRYGEAMFDHNCRHDAHVPLLYDLANIAPDSPEAVRKREKAPELRVPSFENLKPVGGTAKLSRSDFPAIANTGSGQTLPKSLRSKPKSSLPPDKLADKHWSATLPRSFIPKKSSPASKSPTGRSLGIANQDSGPSPPAGRPNKPHLPTRSARTSLNSPTKSSGPASSPKSPDTKQQILRHRRSTVTRPKAPVLLTQLRAERHKSPEEEQAKKCKMTRRSLDQLQTHDLDQANRSPDRDSKRSPTAIQAAIELQAFPRLSNMDLFRTPLPSPIRSEGSASTFVTASEDVEPTKAEDEMESVFDLCGTLDQDPWSRDDGPAPFVDVQFGQRGRLANGISSTHVSTHVSRGRERVRSCDRNHNSYTNGTEEDESNDGLSHLCSPIQHTTSPRSISSHGSQDVERGPSAAIGSSDVAI